MNNEAFRILIVDDNDIYRQLFKNILRSAFPQIAIEEATDGQEALQKVNAFPPDLIFMDIHLRGESGIELTKKIKAVHSEIPVIVFTFYDLPEYREAAILSGADRFLVKSSLSTKEIEELIKFYEPNKKKINVQLS